MRRRRLPWEREVLSKLLNSTAANVPIHIVGHPSAAIGMGEHARSVFRALREAGEEPWLVDIYGPAADADSQLRGTYESRLSAHLGDGINIFCINADEVEQAFEVLADRNLHAEASKNIIYPAWELARYPPEWAKILNRFDEIWAPSQFIADAIAPVAEVSVKHMPLACEIGERGLLSRRHFGIAESAYCFLFSFDFLSYIERKNPLAVMRAFEEVVRVRPKADLRLVLKVNNADRKPELFKRFMKAAEPFRDRMTLIHNSLSDLEMKALMWNCDCYVSLHRSEGFGRGLSEAMVLGKPVIATGYSGNMDFCNDQTAFIVPHELIPVKAGEYPFWQKQMWAEPDVQAAAEFMTALIDQPALGPRKGRAARINILSHFSFLSRGFDYSKRCRELAA